MIYDERDVAQIEALRRELMECCNQYIGVENMYEDIQKERDALQAKVAELQAIRDAAEVVIFENAHMGDDSWYLLAELIGWKVGGEIEQGEVK